MVVRSWGDIESSVEIADTTDRNEDAVEKGKEMGGGGRMVLKASSEA